MLISYTQQLHEAGSIITISTTLKKKIVADIKLTVNAIIIGNI